MNVQKFCEKDSDAKSVTALSLEWNLTTSDVKLCSVVSLVKKLVITHRVVLLSIASSIFNPLGLASPFPIRIRLIFRFIQQKALKSWDEEIPEDRTKQNLEWLQEVFVCDQYVAKRAGVA